MTPRSLPRIHPFRTPIYLIAPPCHSSTSSPHPRKHPILTHSPIFLDKFLSLAIHPSISLSFFVSLIFTLHYHLLPSLFRQWSLLRSHTSPSSPHPFFTFTHSHPPLLVRGSVAEGSRSLSSLLHAWKWLAEWFMVCVE